jgi:predicted Zn-dependent peptidase
VRELVAEKFAGLPQGEELRPSQVVEPPLTEPRIAHLEKDIHQTHLLLGMPTVGMKHDDRSPIKVIERVLSMGGSARLFQRLREQERLVYNINAVTATYEDVGFFAVYTTCNPENVISVKRAILEEFNQLEKEGITPEELAKAKSNYEGTLARRFETNLSIAGIHGVEALLHKVEPFAASIARIKAVTQEDVLEAAKRYLTTKRYVMVTVGREV